MVTANRPGGRRHAKRARAARTDAGWRSVRRREAPAARGSGTPRRAGGYLANRVALLLPLRSWPLGRRSSVKGKLCKSPVSPDFYEYPLIGVQAPQGTLRAWVGGWPHLPATHADRWRVLTLERLVRQIEGTRRAAGHRAAGAGTATRSRPRDFTCQLHVKLVSLLTLDETVQISPHAPTGKAFRPISTEKNYCGGLE